MESRTFSLISLESGPEAAANETMMITMMATTCSHYQLFCVDVVQLSLPQQCNFVSESYGLSFTNSMGEIKIRAVALKHSTQNKCSRP